MKSVIRLLAAILYLASIAVLSAENGQLPVLVEDFEAPAEMRLEGEQTHPGSKLSLSTQDVQEGQKCAELQYVLSKAEADAILCVVTPHRIGSQSFRCSVAVRGDGKGAGLGIVVRDSAGRLYKSPVGAIDFKGWKVVSCRLTRDSWHETSGRASRPRYPLHYYGVYLEGQGDPISGTVAFDSVTVLTKGALPEFVETEFVPGKLFGYFWGQAEVPAGELVVTAPRSVTTTIPVSVRVLDSHGTQVSEVLKEAVSLANGTPVRRSLPIKVDGFGFYPVEIDSGGTVTETAFCWLSSPVAVPEESPFGVTVDVDGLGSRLEAVLDLAGRVGAKWVRSRFLWSRIEQKKGVYAFPEEYDSFVKSAQQKGLHTLVVLGDLNPLYDEGKVPNSEEAVRAFAQYAESTVKRYGTACKHWEIWNGVNSGRYGSASTESPDAYMKLLPHVYRAIKQADPSAKVLGGSVVGIPLPYIEAMMATWLGEGMDAFSVLPTYYPGYYLEYYFSTYIAQLNQRLEAFGAGELNLWLTSIPYSRPVKPREHLIARSAAGRFVRLSLVARTMPFIERLIIHTAISNPKAEPAEEGYEQGLMAQDMSPTVGFAVLHTMMQMMQQKPFRRSLNIGGDPSYPPLCQEFADDKQNVLVAWTRAGKHTLSLKTAAPNVSKTDSAGTSRALQTLNGHLMFRIEDEPVYLTGYGEAEPAPPLFSIAGPTEAAPGETMVFDVTPGPALDKAEVELSVPERWEAKAASPVQFQVKSPNDAAFGVYDLVVRCKTNRECNTGASVSLAERLAIACESVDADTVRITLDHPVSYARTAKREVRITTKDGEGGVQTREEAVNLPANGKIALDIDARAECPDGVATARVDVKITTDRQQTLTGKVYSGATPCYRVSGVKIDADLAEWKAFRPCILDRQYQYAVSSGPAWKDKDDLSAAFWTGWDDEHFYLAARVTDDKHFQPYRGYYMYTGDALRCAFSLGELERTYVLGMNNAGEADFFQLSPSTRSLSNQTAVKVVRKDKETLYEFALKWPVLGVDPKDREKLRFAALVQDSDGSYLKGWLEWFGWAGYRPAPQQLGLIAWTAAKN